MMVGIVVKSTDSDKKWTWLDATDAWHSTENISLASSKSLIFGDSTTQATSATGDISIVSGLTVTNATNIASTGATNAAAIVTNTTNIASTGATNATAIATNVTNIATNVTNIASTGATNAAAIATKDNYQYWTLQGDAATTTNVDTIEAVQFTGAGTATVTLGGTDNRIVTISGAADGGTSYTAGTGLTLVGTEFNTADTGVFDELWLGNKVAGVGTGYMDHLIFNRSFSAGQTCAIGDNAGTNIGQYSICIGTYAGNGAGPGGASYNIFVGWHAGQDNDGDLNIAIGGYAGVDVGAASMYNTSVGYAAGRNADGNYNVCLGNSAGKDTDGDKNVFIGKGAGQWSNGTIDHNIEIVTETATAAFNWRSILFDSSNKINIAGVGSVIVGDTATQRLAIGGVGSGDLSPDATLEIKPSGATDVGMIVQGAVSQSADLAQWQDSSETVLASVAADGATSVSGLITAATGIALQRNTPATTTDKLYNVGGALYFNGSAVDGDTTYTAGSGLQLNGTTFDSLTATTSASGIVQLQDSATDGTTDKAITPNAVYDISGVLAADVASTGTTNAAAIATNTTNIATNVTNIAATGATNAAAIVTNTTNIASTGATNAAAIATNTTNIASTGATNAAAIVTNTTNIASTGATNAAAIATNTTNIATNVTNIAATGATNAAAIATKDNYQYWTLQGDAATTTNVDTIEAVQFTGAGTATVTLGGTDNRIVTISGAADGGTSYTAGTGLTLVGTEFNTANTGVFDEVATSGDLLIGNKTAGVGTGYMKSTDF